jgi:hypothetical protein
MSDEINTVVVESPATVDVKRADAATSEESMAEYGARREAELRGEEYKPVSKAAAVKTESSNVATDSTAATDHDEVVDGENISESATEEGAEGKQSKGKKGLDKRFAELTAARENAQREADQAKSEADKVRAEMEELRAKLAKADEVPIPLVPKLEDDPAPNRSDFDDPDEYTSALSAHSTRSELRKANQAAIDRIEAGKAEIQQQFEAKRQVEVQAKITELHSKFNERVAIAAAEYPDYEAKVSTNEKLTLRNDVFFAIEQAELAPHILYHLADNPAEAVKLNGMSPLDAAMRLGELQAEIRIARKPKPSKAAEPVKPVGNRASPEKKSPTEMSMEEYAKMREKDIKPKGGRRLI